MDLFKNIKESLKFSFFFVVFVQFSLQVVYQFLMSFQIFRYFFVNCATTWLKIEKYNIDIFSSKSDFFRSLFVTFRVERLV